jgi:pimeloyl-ACP methyl ester carboxylesterase
MRAIGKVVVREAAASIRAALVPLVGALRPLPEPRPSDRTPVVMVHGYLGHPNVFRSLSRRMIHQGWGRIERIHYPSTQLGLGEIARVIDDAVAPLAEDGPVDLVGHSLGAVACRAYLKVFGGDRYVRRFVSLGGPHAGTVMYRLAPVKLWSILDPDGGWVRRLNEGAEPVPTTIVRARYDHQVMPPVHIALDGATELVLDGYGHNGLLWAPEAQEAVTSALL